MLLVVVALRSVQSSVLLLVTGMVAAVGGVSLAPVGVNSVAVPCAETQLGYTPPGARETARSVSGVSERVRWWWLDRYYEASCASRWVRRCRYALRVGQRPFLFSLWLFYVELFWTEGRWTSRAEEIQCPANLVFLVLSWRLRANAEVP